MNPAVSTFIESPFVGGFLICATLLLACTIGGGVIALAYMIGARSRHRGGFDGEDYGAADPDLYRVTKINGRRVL